MISALPTIKNILHMNRKELVSEIQKKGSFLCVGLDVDMKKIPEHLQKDLLNGSPFQYP